MRIIGGAVDAYCPLMLNLACRSVPERFMARRPSPAGPGWDVLIKWTNLGHEHSTWEVCCCHTSQGSFPLQNLGMVDLPLG